MKPYIFILTAVLALNTALSLSQPVININKILLEGPDAAIFTGEDGAVMRTENRGSSWSALNSGITNVLRGVDYLEFSQGDSLAKVHLIAAENGIVLKSTDSGVSWQVKYTGTLENLNSVYIYSREKAYICGDNGKILFSSDMGETWSPVESNTSSDLNDISFIHNFSKFKSGVTAVIGGDNGTLLVSTDFGSSWTPSQSGTSVNINTVFCYSTDIFFAGGHNGVVLRTQNSAYSWHSVFTNVSNDIYDLVFPPGASIGIASCEDGMILRSSDYGSTWQSVSTNTTSDLNSVDFNSSGFGMTAGNIIQYSTDFGATWYEEETDRIRLASAESSVKLKQNYPNPFNPSTNISYELPYDAIVSLKVYDMLGKEISTLQRGFRNAGAQSVKFDASNLSSGIYFYVLRAFTGNHTAVKTGRMILTK